MHDRLGLQRVMTSTNDNCIGYLKRHLTKTNVAGGKYLLMRCATHIINLIVHDELREVDLCVKRIRAVVRYIRNGGSRIVKFKELIEEEKLTNKQFLKIDVPTRWNSTFLMLKAALVYEKVFTRLANEDMSYVNDLSEEKDGYGDPEEHDWQNAKNMADFLEHFHDLTFRVSATNHITSHTLFHEIGEVHLLIQSWLNSEDDFQASMVKRMKEKFDKY